MGVAIRTQPQVRTRTRTLTFCRPTQKRRKTSFMLPPFSMEITRRWSSSFTHTKKLLLSLCLTRGDPRPRIQQEPRGPRMETHDFVHSCSLWAPGDRHGHPGFPFTALQDFRAENRDFHGPKSLRTFSLRWTPPLAGTGL